MNRSALLQALVLTAALLLVPALAACDTASPASEAGLDAAARPQPGFTTLHVDVTSRRVTRGRPERVEVCRYAGKADAYKLISVAAPALPGLLRQGGGVPGGAVPGREGYVFDEACQPVAAAAPYTCTTEPGVDASGRNTLTVTGLITDPAYLPVGATVATGTAVISPFEPDGGLDGGVVFEGGVAVGAWASATQYDPGYPSTLLLELVGPNIPAPGFACGPYEFGAPPA